MRLMAPMAGLILAVIGSLVAFAMSLSSVSRQFEHARIAQQQAALVEGIADNADRIGAEDLGHRMAAYRDLIIEEGRLIGAREAPQQALELQRAQQIMILAGRADDRSRLSALVRSIAQSEQGEVAQARADLYRTRRDTLLLGAVLAMAAVVATVIGTLQWRRANRDLASQVAARTAELHAVDQSRRLFFAKASHELRTPVTAIRTIAEVALDGHGAAPLQDIVAQTRFLGHRIDDMLALAGAAEGRPSLTLAPCDLAGVLNDAAAQGLPYARSMDVGIEQVVPAGPVVAMADPRWLTQAMVAIIDNALKFSDPGAGVELSLERHDARAVITIADHGPGVLPRELPRIFDAYYQADAGRMRGGTGLGLALARWVVEQHGGTIHAENHKGCRIVMALPLAGGEGA
jgi:signal transduction histidine kinase